MARHKGKYLTFHKGKLSLPQLLKAIDLLLSSVCFSFDGKYYSQIYGSSMGSPLSPILADIVLDDLEMCCIQKLDFILHTYCRYVDDIFMIIPFTKLELCWTSLITTIPD